MSELSAYRAVNYLHLGYKKQFFKLLKPTGHVMHQQFKPSTNVRSVHTMFCIYLITNSDLSHIQYKLIGFYKRDEKCLLRGTDWVFKIKPSALRL
jgi:hypothetical protein